jgi:threonine synthase
MSFAQEIVCSRCEKRFGLSQLLNLCSCGAPLLVQYDIKKAKAAVAKSVLTGRVASLWRYHELLPLQSDTNLVSLGEGYTPLLGAKKLGAELGLRQLWLKDEGQNPTGSFKDRGLSLAISRAKELGVKKAAIPSAGNAGGSFAAYAARAGIEAHVFMPRDTPIANQREAQQYGAKLTLVDGLINDCGRIIAEKKSIEGWFDFSTLKEPLPRRGQEDDGIRNRRTIRMASAGCYHLSYWRRHGTDRHVEGLRRTRGVGLDRQGEAAHGISASERLRADRQSV